MSNTVRAPYTGRTATRATVQYRSEPYGIRGVRIAFHYGRGIPVRYEWLPGNEQSVDNVATLLREADNGIAPESITTRPPYYFDR